MLLPGIEQPANRGDLNLSSIPRSGNNRRAARPGHLGPRPVRDELLVQRGGPGQRGRGPARVTKRHLPPPPPSAWLPITTHTARLERRYLPRRLLPPHRRSSTCHQCGQRQTFSMKKYDPNKHEILVANKYSHQVAL